MDWAGKLGFYFNVLLLGFWIRSFGVCLFACVIAIVVVLSFFPFFVGTVTVSGLRLSLVNHKMKTNFCCQQWDYKILKIDLGLGLSLLFVCSFTYFYSPFVCMLSFIWFILQYFVVRKWNIQWISLLLRSINMYSTSICNRKRAGQTKRLNL